MRKNNSNLKYFLEIKEIKIKPLPSLFPLFHSPSYFYPDL